MSNDKTPDDDIQHSTTPGIVPAVAIFLLSMGIGSAAGLGMSNSTVGAIGGAAAGMLVAYAILSIAAAFDPGSSRQNTKPHSPPQGAGKPLANLADWILRLLLIVAVSWWLIDRVQLERDRSRLARELQKESPQKDR